MMKCVRCVMLSFVFLLGTVWTNCAFAGQLYFSDVSAVKRTSTSGGNVETLFSLPGSGIQFGKIVLNAAGNEMFVAADGLPGQGIWHADLNGSGVFKIFSINGIPSGLATDLGAEKLYISDSFASEFFVANFDGSGLTELMVAEQLFNPGPIAIDPINQQLYWGERGQVGARIRRGDIVGNTLVNIEDLITTDLVSVGALELDLLAGDFYFTDAGVGLLARAKIDRSLQPPGPLPYEELVTDVDSASGLALDLANDLMYWSERTNVRLREAQLDGNSAMQIPLDQPLSNPAGVALLPSVPEPSSFALLSIGSVALIGYGVRRKRKRTA